MSLTLSPLLAQIPGLRHGFTNRTLSGAEFEAIAASTQLLRQVHADRLIWTDHVEAARPDADAIATLSPAVPIGVQSADCVPLLLVALGAAGKAVGALAVHAGWRGTKLGIGASAFREFAAAAQAEFTGVEFRGAIGPCISGAVYEVGEEVASQFPERASRPILASDGSRKFLLDVEGENARQLESAARGLGVRLELDRLHSCTFSQPAVYPSYRRDGARPDRILSFLEILE